MKTFIKLLALIGIGALVYWFVRERLGGDPSVRRGPCERS